MSDFKLIKKIFFEGKIKTLTGLHIGGSSSAMSIGGIDSIIIRNPIDNKPYIPGSSLKGKMRALIEQRDGTIGPDNGPSDDPKALSSRLFGFHKRKDKQQDTKEKETQQKPSAIIVRDAEILTSDEYFANADVPYAEVKTEVVIDRITAAANPRHIERVPAGTEFQLNMVLNIYSKYQNEEDELINAVFEGLRLIQDDYLGGNGSRGYGQVKFIIEKLYERTAENYHTGKYSQINDISDKIPAELKASENE